MCWAEVTKASSAPSPTSPSPGSSFRCHPHSWAQHLNEGLAPDQLSVALVARLAMRLGGGNSTHSIQRVYSLQPGAKSLHPFFLACTGEEYFLLQLAHYTMCMLMMTTGTANVHVCIVDMALEQSALLTYPWAMGTAGSKQLW